MFWGPKTHTNNIFRWGDWKGSPTIPIANAWIHTRKKQYFSIRVQIQKNTLIGGLSCRLRFVPIHDQDSKRCMMCKLLFLHDAYEKTCNSSERGWARWKHIFLWLNKGFQELLAEPFDFLWYNVIKFTQPDAILASNIPNIPYYMFYFCAFLVHTNPD